MSFYLHESMFLISLKKLSNQHSLFVVRNCHRRCSIKKDVFKNFAKLIGKPLRRILFIVEGEGDSVTGVFLLILRNFSEHLFHRTLRGGYVCVVLCSCINAWNFDERSANVIIPIPKVECQSTYFE